MNSQVTKLKRRKKRKMSDCGLDLDFFSPEEMKHKEELVFANSLESSNLF